MKSLNIYKAKFKKFGNDPKSLLWKTRGAAHQRFRQFWKEIDFDNKTVLDVGCGFGEFGKFLVKRYKNAKYEGIDITEEFINNAKKLYPGINVRTEDFHDRSESKKYDVVIASGILNSNVKNNEKYRKEAINKLFSLTKDVLAFNMLGGHPAPKNKKGSNIHYSDSLEVLKYCLTLTRRVVLRQNYNPKDFTIFMHKVKKGI